MIQFTAILNKQENPEKFDALIQDNVRPGFQQPTPESVTIRKPGFYLEADLTKRMNGTFWVDKSPDADDGSLVMTFGWCYKMSSSHLVLGQDEMAELNREHGEQGKPDLESLSGTFCLLTYNQKRETLWVCADMWAQHGFFFGSNEDFVIASSRAAIVADYLKRPFDGYSYLSVVRGANVPPGRTLFSQVRRATSGRAVHFDIKARKGSLVQIQPLYRPPIKMSYGQAVDRLIGAITSVIPRACKQKNTCVDLTGGQDTRMTTAALAYADGGKWGHEVTFRVVGDPDSRDCIVARKVADAMNWKLVRDVPKMPYKQDEATFLEAAILSDGKYILPLVMHRLVQEKSDTWKNTDALLGSIAGELFRDYVWRHELSKLGTSHKINYDSFLVHKIHPQLHSISEEAALRISHGKLGTDDHNAALVQPYRDHEKALPDIMAYYKMDRFYHLKLLQMTWSWHLIDHRKIMVPYHSQEMTLASMRIPWYLRLGRMIVVDAVNRIAPTVAKINTANYAPMQPFSPKNALTYLNWVISDTLSIYRRHLGKQRFSQHQSLEFSVDPFSIEIVENANHVTQLHDSEILAGVKKKGGVKLNKQEYLEFQAMLMVEVLMKHYNNIQVELDFDCDNINFKDAEVIL